MHLYSRAPGKPLFCRKCRMPDNSSSLDLKVRHTIQAQSIEYNTSVYRKMFDQLTLKENNKVSANLMIFYLHPFQIFYQVK